MADCLALIRVRFADRPGALGLVASRIGALRGDIVGIEVLDRSHGLVLDELAIVLPDESLIPAVTREIGEVDGAITQSVLIVDALPEPRLDAVHAAIALGRAEDASSLASTLADQLHHILRPSWCTVSGDDFFAVAGDQAPRGRDELAEAVADTYAIGAHAVVTIARDPVLSSIEQRLVRAYCDFAEVLHDRQNRGVR